MEDKKLLQIDRTKHLMLVCAVRALAVYAVFSFMWLSFIAMGTNDNTSTSISLFADRLVMSNLAIALFSAVYGFSLLIMRLGKMSGPAKYSLHILVNYITAMVCVYMLFSNVESEANGWMVFILFATVIFFVIYGIASLLISLIKKKLN